MSMQQATFPHSSPETAPGQGQMPGEQGVPQGQYTKLEANYRPSGGSSTRCADCAFFVEGRPNMCQKVAGPVDYDGVSDFFQPRGRGLGDLITAAGGGM